MFLVQVQASSVTYRRVAIDSNSIGMEIFDHSMVNLSFVDVSESKVMGIGAKDSALSLYHSNVMKSHGTGVTIFGGSLSVKKSTLSENFGTGLQCANAGTVDVVNSSMDRNGNGASWLESCDSSFTGVTWSENTALGSGGGIMAAKGSSLFLSDFNSSFNRAGRHGVIASNPVHATQSVRADLRYPQRRLIHRYCAAPLARTDPVCCNPGRSVLRWIRGRVVLRCRRRA